MDFGMPTLIETKSLKECAALCRALDLRFIELNMNLPQYQLPFIDAGFFMETAEQYGIYYTVHLDENLNVSDFNPKVVQAYRQTVLETITLAKILKIPVLNMHLSKGVYFTLPDKKVYLFDVYRNDYLKSICIFRDECEEAIDNSDILICIENSDGFTAFQTEALDLLLESPAFGLTFDIGHNHGIGGADEAVIMKRADKLCHMHMHDAAGKRDHLALGTGELDLPRYFSLAGIHSCRAVLETKTILGLKESVKWMKGKKR